MSTDKTDGKQSNLIPFKPGQSGNPKGRPKGARNKLAEAWEREGARAIQRVIDTKPEIFIKVVADLMPKDMNLTINKYEHMTDDQLLQRVKAQSETAAPILAQMGGQEIAR